MVIRQGSSVHEVSLVIEYFEYVFEDQVTSFKIINEIWWYFY